MGVITPTLQGEEGGQLLVPHYEVELRKDRVEIYLRNVGDKYEAKVVYHGRCFGSC